MPLSMTSFDSAARRVIFVFTIALICLFNAPKAAQAQHPSWINSAVIYNVQPEIFSSGANFAGVTAQLTRLHNMGVNVIWIEPVTPRGQPITIGGVARPAFNSPYCVHDFYGINPNFGAGADLTNLVTSAHNLGMKVILDEVLNHSSWDNALITQHPEYYLHSDGVATNVNSIEAVSGLADVAQFNYASTGLQSYMTTMLQSWITTYGIDGFRFDTADNPPGTGRLIPQSFWQALRTSLETTKTDILMLGEEENVQLALAPFELDYGWNMLFYGIRSAFTTANDASTLQYQWLHPYTASNTAPAGMLQMNVADDWDLDRDVVTLGGYPQAMAAAVWDFTITGVPLMYNGMEVANNNGGVNPHTLINWNGPNATQFTNFYSQLLALRNGSGSALQQGTLTWVTNSSAAVASYDRTGGGNEYLIEINTNSGVATGTISPLAGGAWIEVTPVGAPGGQSHPQPPNITLQGYDFTIFQRSSGPPPAATPTFSLASGTYIGTQTLTMSDATSGATIHYTTNGTTPTSSSTAYTGPISVASTETVEAIATASGDSNSGVFSASYTVFPGTGGGVSGTPTVITTAQTFNLTTQGTTDWAAWGLIGSGTFDHKSSGGSQISNMSAVGNSGAGQFANSILGLTWTDGTPDATATNTLTGLYVNATALGNGFSFTVPADTGTRTLVVYLGGWETGGKLTAHLSDFSATDYTNTSMSSTTGSYYGSYSLTYHAGQAGQTLTITWVANSGTGNVTLQGVTPQGGTGTPTAATPTFSPAPGTYGSSQNVTLSDTTTGASIFYTTDGTTPTPSSTHYTAPIAVTSTKTIQAIATATGFLNSNVASGVYTIVTVPAAPTGLTATGGNAQVVLNWSATSGATTYNVYRSTTAGGEGTTAIATGITATTYTNTGLTNGTTYYYKIAAVNLAGTSGQSGEVNAKPVAPVEAPYGGTAWAIPGTVQAENYDTGGEGLGYHVTSINGTANSYRTDGVDLETTTDTGGGDNVGWSAAGQWFRYTVNVATAGTYTVSFRVANGSGASTTLHVSNSAGTNLTGTVTVPNTGGWQTWSTVTATVTLPAGRQVLTINQDGANINLNYISFASSGGGGYTGTPYTGTAIALPGTVQAENFDKGGEGVAYHDADAANQGGQYRTTEGVDIETCSDTGGGFDVGWTQGGEWEKYTVNASTAKTYAVTFRIASGFASGTQVAQIHLEDKNGTNLTGTLNVIATGGWQTWTNLTANATLPAGSNVLRLYIDGSNNGFNINYMTLN